jgi:hypothetical protein
MSNARQVMEWLLQGKKVRRADWENKSHFIFLDFEKNTISNSHGFITISTLDNTDWELFPEPKKLDGPYWKWEYLADDKTIFSDCYYDEKFINPLNFTAKYLTESKWKRKIGDPIWFNEDETPVNIDGNILT